MISLKAFSTITSTLINFFNGSCKAPLFMFSLKSCFQIHALLCYKLRVFINKILSHCLTQGDFLNRSLIVFMLRFFAPLVPDQIINANSRRKLNWIFANVHQERQFTLCCVSKDFVSVILTFLPCDKRKQENTKATRSYWIRWQNGERKAMKDAKVSWKCEYMEGREVKVKIRALENIWTKPIRW